MKTKAQPMRTFLTLLLLEMAAFLPLVATADNNTADNNTADGPADPTSLVLGKTDDSQARNVVFILVDDHRYDAMGFVGHPFLETPRIDALAAAGTHFKNAFVTTSLCSPSRATILTGLYMHNHGVIDNQTRVVPGNTLFPQYLHSAGYETAFIGKWHMGGSSDEPRPGFDHWVSFRGQGRYFPARGTVLNVNGRRVPQKRYMTDELTDYAVGWLEERQPDRPFFLYLSHKGVHGLYDPAPRHLDKYKDAVWTPPVTMADTPENRRGKPLWVQNQRNSWHGVEFPYHGDSDLGVMYKHYCEMILSIDESLGRVIDCLEEKGLLDQTLVIYMGDNGHFWGEHGLIDKRSAYEESIRVPLIAACTGLLEPGRAVEAPVANVDIAPTILEAAGLKPPPGIDGQSFLPLATGRIDPGRWRPHVLYEYYWEWTFPHTPTTFALRGSQYKLIQYQGVWDTDELYDIQNDPRETDNLIRRPEYQTRVKKMRAALYEELKRTGGLQIPLGYKRAHGNNLRRRGGSLGAEFPDYFFKQTPKTD